LELEFLPFEKNYYEEVLPYFALRPTECSESQFAYHVIWKDYYNAQFCLLPSGVIWMQKIANYPYASLVPVCKKEELRGNFQLLQDYLTNVKQAKLIMYLVDEEALEIIAPDPLKYEIIEDVNSFDYIYDAEKLRLLSGKKYHKKKNHVNAFLKEYGERYEYKKLSLEHTNEILEFSKKWAQAKDSDDELNRIESEEIGIRNLLDAYAYADIRMGGIYIDGVLEAFTIGNYNESMQMAIIHIEKANSLVRGLYPFINQQFLVHEFPKSLFVNREDDMGLPSLRKAKEAYHPIKMGKKYTIQEK
jgi:hypothetical protein